MLWLGQYDWVVLAPAAVRVVLASGTAVEDVRVDATKQVIVADPAIKRILATRPIDRVVTRTPYIRSARRFGERFETRLCGRPR